MALGSLPLWPWSLATFPFWPRIKLWCALYQDGSTLEVHCEQENEVLINRHNATGHVPGIRYIRLDSFRKKPEVGCEVWRIIEQIIEIHELKVQQIIEIHEWIWLELVELENPAEGLLWKWLVFQALWSKWSNTVIFFSSAQSVPIFYVKCFFKKMSPCFWMLPFEST